VTTSRSVSTVDIIAGRTADLGGGFTVRRTLPVRARRHVGPFVFWDHMGPVHFDPGVGIDVRPHPHIGLATITYLFDGEIVHKDSLGSAQSIRPGDVNWMTAGRGIVHSERTGPEMRRHGSLAHGIQSWVALPLEQEESEPRFEHTDGKEIPSVQLPGARLRVIAGSAFGSTSPVKVLSPMFYVEAVLEAGASLSLPMEAEERAAYLVEGAVSCDGQSVSVASMAVASPGTDVSVVALEPSRVMLLGGAPLGERHIWWNFVSSSRERIEAAKLAWMEDRFPKVPGETERVPLP
jgi:redox-sensitive bicupin YhaK (pirin superfamily)